MIKNIEINKNKLVLLSKLLKDVKNIYKNVEGKELLVYKYKTQRRIVETIFTDKALNIYIDKLKNILYKEAIKKQAEGKIENYEENEVMSDSL